MRRAVALLCIALCVSAASAADSKFPSTWISDYLSSPKASVMSGYYDEVEKATMCFRTASWCEVGTPPQELDTLTCSACPEDSHYRKQEEDSEFAITDVGSILGKCMFQKTTLTEEQNIPLIGSKPGFKWAGTFYGTCYLEKSGKDICELPEGCEDTVLQIQGVIYNVEKAVRVGPAQKNVNECDSGLKRVGNTRNGAKVPTEKKDTATVQYAKEYFYEVDQSPKKVPAGPARVFDGTFTVFGSHALKWKEGRFQYSWFESVADVAVQDLLNAPRLGDDIYKMEFVGGSKGRY